MHSFVDSGGRGSAGHDPVLLWLQKLAAGRYHMLLILACAVSFLSYFFSLLKFIKCFDFLSAILSNFSYS